MSGLKFGVDICLDHGHKVLKSSLNGETVDVHVLIADGAAPSSRSLATTTNLITILPKPTKSQIAV